MKNKILTSIAGRLIVFLALMTFGLQAVTAQTVLNNNKIRIGNGTESSINSFGNMQQPFYYNQTLNLWRQLTYSSYPLDNAFATGGSGTSEWNITGTLVQNPALTGQVLNHSQYVSTGTNMGYGKIISTGNITVGEATLQVEYTYTLGQNSSFIQIKCKVTNVGTATATNVRTWLGTRDDFVGDSDVPTKTRGNLVNGAFAAISSTSVQAKALKIESGVEGVLFYTTHPRAYTSINSCCSFTNAINTNPLSSAVTVTSDNSYAMYVRFNDLPVGASDEFSLYYAAGDIADLEEIINEVAQASGAISNITTNSAVFTSSSAAATTGYYVVVPQGATPPTAAQIQAGTNYGSTVVANSGTAAMAANASVTYNLTGLAPSTPYTLYFVSYNGTAYSTIYNANFTTLAPLTATMSSSTNIACNGGTTGAATVTAAGANPPYTYLWSNGATTATVTGLAAGTYTVTVTDSNNQTATQTVTITQPAALTASPASQTNVSCNGGSNGSAAVAVTGGTGTYTYSWSPSGGTAAAATGLAAGTYTVTVTDANGCEATQSFTITQPTALAATPDTQTNVSCNGGSNGSAAVAVTGGTGTYTYSWAPFGGTAAAATGLTAGTYTVTVTDSNSCQATQSFTITEPSTLQASSDTQTNVTCNGGSNGSAAVAVTGGTAPYTYSWSPSGGTNATATGLSAGSYTVTVADANGCQATQSFTITQPSALAATTSASNVSCPGHYDGTAAINVTGGTAPYTYVWNNGGVTNVITGLTAGVYVVTVTDANGCLIEKQVFVNTTPDTTAPTPNKASLSTITKECAVTAADIPVPTANDNCVGTVMATTTDELIYTDQGTYTITWTYNDRNGNRSTQLQTVIVKDVSKPIPAVASLPTITKQCAVTAADIPVPTANDNCAGIITATTTDALVYTAQGTYTINWTYNDGNGNITTQQQTIVVDDVTAPVPTVVTLPTITSECAVIAADIPVPTANDNCSGIITATTTDALAYTEQGTYTINWTYNDGNGNITTQQQNIVVDDVTKPVPVIASLPTITKECAVTAADIPVPTANDNCAGIITATTTDALAYNEQGTYTINWTYNDGNGNTVTQQQTIIVDDVTAPVPTVVTLPTITKECAVRTADIPVPAANDNCAGIITATTTDALAYTAQGTYIINWTYNDGNGNTTTQQQTIIVDDVTAPVAAVASLPTITKECAVTAADIPVPTANDNCVGIISATTTDALTYTEQGTYTINWTYNDGNGNTTTQQQTIVVDDVTAPVPAIASLPTITRECTVTAADIPVPTANDNCVGIISATTTDALAYTEQGTYTINWTYNDGNGNTTIQQQTIVVDDVTKPVPVIASLPTITKECVAADIPVPTAIDNCAGTITATTTDALAYTEQGTYTINWTYNDGNGNTATQQQTIVVDDVTAPVPTVVTLPTITRECAVIAADFPVPTAIDNCTGTITATTTDALAYTEQGTYTINWTYNDGNGNTVTQQQTIVVDDVTAPVPAIASLPTITKECAVRTADIPVPTANDNCVGIISATTTDALAYTEQGTYTINWTYNDGNGNTTTQQQTIVVDDVTVPVPTVVTLPTITKECAVTAADIPVPTANDNCAGIITATTTDALAYTEQGTYTINWTYNDGNGNTATQQQTIVVDDVTAPVPTVASLPTITRECAVIAADIPVPTANDNCAGVITATTTDALAYTAQGTYTINWTYNDGNGNTYVQQQTVIVEESPLAAIVLNDLTTVYNGTVHNLMVANMPAGAAVSYSIAPQAEEDNGAVNAGTYTVTAVVTPPASAVNCEPVTLTAELVIEKAAQNIQFDELEVVLLETAADFQLDATASSGLPVTYTYTYDQSTPAATVSPEGWVEILHSGSVLITAHQQGNINYLPAASVERSLLIESKDATIQQIVVNGVVYSDPDAVIYYMLDCNDTTNEVPVQIDAEFGATVSPARDFVIGIPKPGVYRNTVEVVSEDGTSVQRYQIIVERPFAFDDIVAQKFNNTLLINNNPQTNGGYRFVKYEWYKNDVLIGTEQVYSAGNSKQDILDENALYRAVLTTENGDVIHTCASEITRTNNFKINVYPNPVRVNEQLQVVFDYPSSAFKGASASLYTTSGKLLQSVKLNENVSSVQLPAGLSEGIYMLVLQIEGRQETVKVVVKQ